MLGHVHDFPHGGGIPVVGIVLLLRRRRWGRRGRTNWRTGEAGRPEPVVPKPLLTLWKKRALYFMFRSICFQICGNSYLIDDSQDPFGTPLPFPPVPPLALPAVLVAADGVGRVGHGVPGHRGEISLFFLKKVILHFSPSVGFHHIVSSAVLSGG